MIFHLTFRTQQLQLPLSYQSCVQGLIYHLLSAVPEYSDFLHNTGYLSDRQQHFKVFCFSRLTGDSSVHGKQIVFRSTVCFSLRTADPICAEILSYVLQPDAVYQLCGQPIILDHIKQSELEIADDVQKVKISMLSPMTVYTTTSDRKTHYFNPLDAEFPLSVNQNYHRKWQSVVGAPASDDIELITLSVGSRDKVVTKIKHIYVTAWGGTYLLKGSADAIRFLYHTGLGSKNSMGFGLFDIVK